MQTLKNCQMSMGQIFHEQTAAERIASDEEFMRGFVDSPEYRSAFEAYAKRMGKK